MYIPQSNAFNDRSEIIDFIKRFSFGTIITTINEKPVATHLPFIIEDRAGVLVVISHFALGNSQWKSIESENNLFIFSEPHAYISPAHYESEINVPTWNYISVHLYGKCTIIKDPKKVTEILEHTIENYEIGYKDQWNKLPLDYKSSMIKGIVAFECIVDDIQAKKKLSQNKTLKEQGSIIETLSKSNDTNEQAVAAYMKKNLD